MQRTWIITAAELGALSVALGAFGAHGLADTLAASGREETFRTAVQYQMYHSLALLAAAWLVGLYPQQRRLTTAAGALFTGGILLFSGSLYMLAIFDLGIMGAVAPFGGAALIGGWCALGLAAWRER